MIQAARLLGQPLMPWQEHVAMVGGEINSETGLPAYRTVFVTVPRQSGKTTLFLTWEVQRATGWRAFGPQRIVYSAQTGNDARKKLIEDQVPVLERHQKRLGIQKILKGIGSESVIWNNGSRLVLMASGEDAGHGKTVDLGIIDELFADVDERRFQALRPAMLTKPFAQVLVSSTMGTDASVTLNQRVARGRAAVEADKRSGMAYFEWSAPEDADPDDPATWRACMPALGFTQSEDTVRGEREDMKDGDFRRAMLNQQTSSDDRVIPLAEWDAACSTDAKPSASPAFAVDVNPERSAGSIVAASGGSVPVCELAEHQPGTGWIVEAASAMSKLWGNAVVAVDSSGPAASLIPELKAAQVPVREIAAKELVAACGSFFDRVLEGRVRVRRHPMLDAAAAGASKRQSSDAWAWARKHTAVDVSPLVAATLAVWVAAASPVVGGLVDPNDYDD